MSVDSVSQDLSHEIYRYRDAISIHSTPFDGVHFFLRHLFLAIMIIGMKTCVTINFDLFQCFTKQFFFSRICFHLARPCHISGREFSVFLSSSKNIWYRKRHLTKFRLTLVIIVEGDFFFFFQYDTLNFRAWNHNLGHKFPPDYLKHFSNAPDYFQDDKIFIFILVASFCILFSLYFVLNWPFCLWRDFIQILFEDQLV